MCFSWRGFYRELARYVDLLIRSPLLLRILLKLLSIHFGRCPYIFLHNLEKADPGKRLMKASVGTIILYRKMSNGLATPTKRSELADRGRC